MPLVGFYVLKDTPILLADRMGIFTFACFSGRERQAVLLQTYRRWPSGTRRWELLKQSHMLSSAPPPFLCTPGEPGQVWRHTTPVMSAFRNAILPWKFMWFNEKVHFNFSIFNLHYTVSENIHTKKWDTTSEYFITQKQYPTFFNYLVYVN